VLALLVLVLSAFCVSILQRLFVVGLALLVLALLVQILTQKAHVDAVPPVKRHTRTNI
jgi:hypothetical protein